LAVSAITLWELGLLVNRGRIQTYGTVESSIWQLLEDVTTRPITYEIAALAVQFPDDYPRDPADRLIGATSRAEGLSLDVTGTVGLSGLPLLTLLSVDSGYLGAARDSDDGETVKHTLPLYLSPICPALKSASPITLSLPVAPSPSCLS